MTLSTKPKSFQVVIWFLQDVFNKINLIFSTSSFNMILTEIDPNSEVVQSIRLWTTNGFKSYGNNATAKDIKRFVQNAYNQNWILQKTQKVILSVSYQPFNYFLFSLNFIDEE